VKSCPYCDVSSEAYARLNAMIETANEQHEHLLSEMRECGLLYEIDPRLEASHHEDCESSLPLESNVVDDALS